MATQVETMGTEGLVSTTSLPPPYLDGGDQQTELDTLSTTSSIFAPPGYEDAIPMGSPDADFRPTHHFQVETMGHALFRLPLPPNAGSILIYAVDESGEPAGLAYESVKPTRGSGNSFLYHAATSTQSPVCATTYRFGPGRPPKIRLLSGTNPDAGAATQDEPGPGDEEFEVVGHGCATRRVTIRTHLGTYQWRYARKADRLAAGADSLLVMERVTSVAKAGGRSQEVYQRVAQLVRNVDLRTAGTVRSTAGNGGRLMVDMRDWVDGKTEARQMETFVVASCLVMLKKEIDRRRLHQAMVIGGAASGGP